MIILAIVSVVTSVSFINWFCGCDVEEQTKFLLQLCFSAILIVIGEAIFRG